MSIWSSIVSGVKSIVSSPVAQAAATVIGGPIGATVAAGGALYSAYQSSKAVAPTVMPGLGATTSMGLMGLSPQAVGRGAAAVVKGARAIPRAAVALCRKYPTWCSTIGGTVAVEALFNSGQLPVPKKRRGRGITAGELKSFKRVARFTHKYCAPVHHAMRSPAMRRHKGATCQ